MSWPMAVLGEVCEIISGATPKSNRPEYWDGDVAWVTPKDLSALDGKYLFDTPRKITDAGLRSCSARMLPLDSLLFSSRAPIGHVALNRIPVCTNQGFKSLVPVGDSVDTNYLYWWFKANRPALERMGRGATFKEVSKRIVEQIVLPLPPVVEQQRIARILDAAEALRAKRRESIAQLDALVQSTFLKMFGDPVRNAMRWEVRQLGSLLRDIEGGWSPICLKRPAGETEWGVLKLGAVTQCKFDATAQKALPKDVETRPNLEVCSGDILFARKNTAELVAAVAYVRSVRPLLTFPDLMFRLRIDPVVGLNSVFLWQLLIESRQRSEIRALASGAAGSMPNISKEKLKKVLIIKPPLDLQHCFAEIVGGIEAHRDRLRAHLAELDTLFASLQSRAFAGEL